MQQINQALLDKIAFEIEAYKKEGKVAQYIPNLRNINPDQFGMLIRTSNDEVFSVGQVDTLFSIQSISKVFALAMAIKLIDRKVWERLGREPSGNKFNSLVQLENEKGIPRNPFINAGALVITDILISLLDDPKKEFLDFIRELAGDNTIEYDQELAKSEQSHGYTNAALVNYMKSHGNIKNKVEDVLDVYFHQCSIMVNCKILSNCFMFLANNGYSTISKEQIITSSQAKRINAIMLTCGFYDQAGEFAYRVGLPGKSGVSGGIAALFPGNFSTVVWSPNLNNYGNSVVGIEALDRLTTYLGKSIF